MEYTYMENISAIKVRTRFQQKFKDITVPLR
jgi:hypothetical protein